MKKFTLVALAMMASASCFAQTTLWNGEDKAIGADHTSNGFWNRCNPVVVANPDRGGINNTEKCVKFRISGKDWNNGSIGFNLPNGEAGLDISQCKRFSIMIKKSTNSVVKVQLANGKAKYWKNIAANYTGNGEWQKLVFDFSVHSPVFKDNNPVEMAIYPDVDAKNTDEDIYVDDIVLEANPTVNDGSLWAAKENSLEGNLKLTGGYFKTTCMNADVDPWETLNIDDFDALNKRLSANVTSIDMSEASTIGVDINQFFEGKNPNTIVYANEPYDHANVVVNGTAKSVELTDANAFNAPEDFTATTVKLTRGVQKGINSFVLPFAATADELGATQVATYDRYGKDGDNKVYFNPVEEGVKANTPFLTMDVAEDKVVNELNFGEKKIVATPENLGTDFVGVYAKTSATDKYGINAEGKLQKGGTDAYVNAFHAYLNVTGSVAPAAVAFNGSTPTAINGVTADKVANTAVYDLSGRRVYGKLQKGLYIMNGKKVVVK